MKNLPWLLFVFVSCILLFIYWVIVKPAGTGWLLNTFVNKVEGLQISEFDGRLLDSLKASEFRYERNGTVVVLNDLTVDYDLNDLLSQHVVVRQAHVEKIRIVLPEKIPADEPSTAEIRIPSFTSKVHLEIESLHVGMLEFSTGTKTSILSDIVVSASMQDDVLKVSQFMAEVDGYRVKMVSDFEFSEPFPFNLDAKISSMNDQSKVSLLIEGLVNNYRIKSISNMDKKPLPALSLSLDGRGSLQELQVIESELLTLGGHINLAGSVSWLDGLSVDLDFSGKGIDPGQYDVRYTGDIDFTGKTKTTGTGLQTTLQATGQLRGYPLEIDTQLVSKDTATRIDAGEIIVGSNSLNVQGGVTTQGLSDFSFKVNAPGLDQLSPELSGKITGDGTADGHWDKLQLKAIVIGNALGFAENKLDGFSLEINPTDNLFEYRLNAKAIGVKTGDVALQSVQVSAVASREHQRARFEIQGGPQGLKASGGLEGEYQNDQWKGDIRGVSLTANSLPVYVQPEPATFVLSADQQTLAPFCLKNHDEEFCIQADINQLKEGGFTINLADFPFKRLAPWVPAASDFSDQLEAELTASGQNGHWDIQAKALIDSKNQMQVLMDYASVARTMDGTLQANFNKLDWINLLSDKVVVSGGELVANLDLGGHLVKPEIQGAVDFQKMNIRLPDAGVEYKDIELHAQLAADQTVRIKGVAISGGELGINGKLDWHALPAWNLNLAVSGERVEMLHLPTGNVFVSPALDITASDVGVAIKGVVAIPKAMIHLGGLSDSAIKPSADEIIIGGESPNNRRQYPVKSTIHLQLGQQVHLDGYGLDTRVEGDLKIAQEANAQVEADGTLKLQEGTYKAYGQDLAIERGEVYFNGPLEPHLNIRATRTIEAANVIAGLQVTGTIEQPESHIFSTPSMSESDALSYLLTGKPLGGSDEDSNLLMNAAIGLGIKGSAGLIEDIRSETGLDTVEINSGQDSTQTYLALGKYLSPRFYIQYATKLFNSSQVFSMRYQLTRKLFLEAETGDDEDAVDLMYQFER